MKVSLMSDGAKRAGHGHTHDRYAVCALSSIWSISASLGSFRSTTGLPSTGLICSDRKVGERLSGGRERRAHRGLNTRCHDAAAL